MKFISVAERAETYKAAGHHQHKSISSFSSEWERWFDLIWCGQWLPFAAFEWEWNEQSTKQRRWSEPLLIGLFFLWWGLWALQRHGLRQRKRTTTPINSNERVSPARERMEWKQRRVSSSAMKLMELIEWRKAGSKLFEWNGAPRPSPAAASKAKPTPINCSAAVPGNWWNCFVFHFAFFFSSSTTGLQGWSAFIKRRRANPTQFINSFNNWMIELMSWLVELI